jgi:gluconolactonase
VTVGARRRRVVLPVLAVVLAAGAAITLVLDGSKDGSADPIAASYPEGPLSQGDKLFFAEMGADRVSVVEDGAARMFFTQPHCGPTAIAPYGGGYLVLCHLGRRAVALSAAGEERRRWVADADGNALMDPNDASADGRGGVYFSDPGVFSRSTEPHGRVLHLAADGRLRIVADTLWYPNGVYVDRVRKRLYVSEHLAGRVLRFQIGPDGSLGPSSTFVRMADAERSDRYATPYEETGPDGLEIGPNGELYVVVYGEGRVLRFARNGAYRGAIELPTRYATNITFSPDGSAATTGSFTNVDPPFAGEVRFHDAEAMTKRPSSEEG